MNIAATWSRCTTEDEKDKEDEAPSVPGIHIIKASKATCNCNEKDLLVYRIDYNEYTGGAHGIYRTTLTEYGSYTDASTCLDDIFVGDYKDPLTGPDLEPAHGRQQSDNSRSLRRYGM